jgi:hypothetical protein
MQELRQDKVENVKHGSFLEGFYLISQDLACEVQQTWIIVVFKKLYNQ